MFDVPALRAFSEPLSWFLTLGKSDTQGMRDEIRDLLTHASQSIRSLIELEQVLADVTETTFTPDGFWKTLLHAEYTYTNDPACEQARTHCTDIQRDLRRIHFKATKKLRTELGEWKNVDQSFAALVDADRGFLEGFRDALRRVGAELRSTADLLLAARDRKDEGMRQLAWTRFTQLRSDLRNDVTALHDVVARLREAEEHISRVLT